MSSQNQGSTKRELRELAKEINTALKRRNMVALHYAGQNLLRAKANVKEGHWMRWCKANVKASQATWSKAMNLARRFPTAQDAIDDANQRDARGLKCPNCNTPYRNGRTIRNTRRGCDVILRERKCPRCQFVIPTKETIDLSRTRILISKET